MNIPIIFRFLKNVAANNNREWFAAHRDQYEAARTEFDRLVELSIACIGTFDESIRGIEPKDCTYRIYRDTRFTEDKTPYKIYLGAYINACGKKSPHCGYYLHLEPENCLVAGGSYCLPPKALRALRQAVYDNMDEYRSIVEDPAFNQYFPQVGETFLKTAPKGFPRDYEFIRYLQCKEYTVCCPLPDKFFLNENFMDELEKIYRQMKRFGDFVNFTIDDYI